MLKLWKRKNNIYYARGTINGRRYQFSLKTKDMKVAKIRLARFEREMLEKEFSGEKEVQQLTYDVFFDEYLDWYKMNRSEKSAEYYTTTFPSKINPFFSGKLLNEITIKDIEDFKIKRLKDNVTPATVNSDLKCLRTMFNKAVEWDYLNKNIIKASMFLAEYEKDITWYRLTDVEKIIEYVNREKGYFEIAVLLGLQAGLRWKEIIHLEKSQLDFDRDVINVINRIEKNQVKFKTKGKKNRYVPMPPDLKKALQRYLKTHTKEYLFMRKDNTLIKDMRKRFTKMSRDLEFKKPIRSHQLRHTYASHLVLNGTPFNVVQELLGHQDIATTMIYSHLRKEYLYDAVNQNLPYGYSSKISDWQSDTLTEIDIPKKLISLIRNVLCIKSNEKLNKLVEIILEYFEIQSKIIKKREFDVSKPQIRQILNILLL